VLDIPNTDLRWDGPPGHWFPVHRSIPDKWTAIIICPTCERPFEIPQHTIADDGTVAPSVVCGYQREGCSFHEYVRLIDWRIPNV